VTASDHASADPAPARRSLAADTAALTFGGLLSQGAALITILVLARLVSAKQLGTYQQLSLIYGITAPFLLGGIPAALLYFLARSKSRVERDSWIVRAYLLLSTLGVVAALLIVVLRGPMARLMNNPPLADALLAYAPYAFFAVVFAAAPSILIATHRASAAAALNALNGGASLAAVTSAALISPDARALALGLSTAMGVVAVVSVVATLRPVRGALGHLVSLSRTDWSPLLSYGFPLAFAGFAAGVGYQFDRFVVGANFSTRAFAVYALGAIELPFSLLIQQSITNVLAPALAGLWQRGDRESMLALWREATRKSSLLMAPLFAFFMFNAPNIVHVLYGAKYAASTPIFRIYLLLMPLRITTWGLMSQAVGRTRINFVAAGIILATNVVVALSLVGPLGLRGPALAAPAGALASSLYYVVRMSSILEAPVRRLLPFRRIVATFLVACAAAAVTFPLSLTSLPPLAELALAVGLFLPLYLLLASATGFLTPADRSRLIHASKRFRKAPA
jgi:O-antigen/teichoic acid export membrane protein